MWKETTLTSLQARLTERAKPWRLRAVAVAAGTCLAAVGLASPASATAATANDTTTNRVCTKHRVSVDVRALGPVTDVAGDIGEYEVYGELCRPKGAQPKVAHVLVHGYSLDHSYWDSAYKPEKYSYVEAVTDAGYATFNIDRLGVGKSDMPPAPLANPLIQVDTVAQVVDKVRDGTVGGHAFEEVVIVGHSYGSWISKTVAAQHKNVDGVVVTGLLNRIQYQRLAKFFPLSMIPAQMEDDTADAPAGYLVRRDGMARKLFFTPETPQPIIDNAERHRPTADPLVALIFEFEALPKDIDVPVLLVTGNKDHFLCSTAPVLQALYDCSSDEAMRSRSKPFLPNAPSVEAYAQPGAGHNNAQDINASSFYQRTIDWTKQKIG